MQKSHNSQFNFHLKLIFTRMLTNMLPKIDKYLDTWKKKFVCVFQCMCEREIQGN